MKLIKWLILFFVISSFTLPYSIGCGKYEYAGDGKIEFLGPNDNNLTIIYPKFKKKD